LADGVVGMRCANRCGCVSTPANPRAMLLQMFSHDVEPLLYPTMPRCQKKVPEQRGLPFSGSTWQTAAYRTQRPNRHCCRSKGAATPRVNGLLHSEPYSAARTRLPLGHRLRALLLASPAASASRRRNRLRRLLARLPAAGASACCSGWGYGVSPITVCYYTPSMTALSRGSPRVFENSSSTHQTTITQPPQPTHNKKIPPPRTRRYCTIFHNTN
jgi:hypothetical protein